MYFKPTEEKQLLAIVKEKPSETLASLGQIWVKRHAPDRKPPSPSTVMRVLHRHGYAHRRTVWVAPCERRTAERRAEIRVRPETPRRYPSDLTDEQWEAVASLVQRPGRRGPAPREPRQLLNAMLYVQRTGCQWRYLPRDFPSWERVSRTFYRWRDNGVWQRVCEKLL